MPSENYLNEALKIEPEESAGSLEEVDAATSVEDETGVAARSAASR